MAQKLALFDFDGTITETDTLFHFLGFFSGNLKLYASLLLLSPIIILMKLRLVKNQYAKESLLKFHIKNTTAEKFESLCKAYCTHKLPDIIRQQALERINYHKSA